MIPRDPNRIFSKSSSFLLIAIMMSSLMTFAFFGFGVKPAAAEATYAPILLGALAEHANWFFRDDGGFAGQYAAGKKHLEYVGLCIRFIRQSDLIYEVHVDAVYLASGDPIQFEDVTLTTSSGTLTAVGNPSINARVVRGV